MKLLFLYFSFYLIIYGFATSICNSIHIFQESGATFCQITAMYSELLVLDSEGKLHQWKWSEQDSYSSAEVSPYVQ